MIARHLVKRGVFVRLAAVILVAGVLAGCDKCGNRLKPNLPTLPAACGDNADPAR